MTNLEEQVKRKGWISLTPEEEVKKAVHPSLWAFVDRFLIGSIMVFAGLYIAWAVSLYALLLIPAGVAIAGLGEWERRNTWYVVTEEEVYKKEGIITTEQRQARHDKIQDTNYTKDIIETIFNFGDLSLTTAGTATTELTLQNAPNPAELKDIITEQVDIATQRQYTHSREEAEERTGYNDEEEGKVNKSTETDEGESENYNTPSNEQSGEKQNESDSWGSAEAANKWSKKGGEQSSNEQPEQESGAFGDDMIDETIDETSDSTKNDKQE